MSHSMTYSEKVSRFKGCLLAHAIADAAAAPFEGASTADSALGPFDFERRPYLKYSDDGEMTLGAAESLAECGGFDDEHMAKTWANHANAHRGYGGGVVTTLRMIREGKPWAEASRAVFSDGSYGNGAAMRVSPFGLLYASDREKLQRTVARSAEITHAHPAAIQGAQLIASAVSLAASDEGTDVWFDQLRDLKVNATYGAKLDDACEMVGHDTIPLDVVSSLGNTVDAEGSAVTSIYLAIRFINEPLAALIGFAIDLGGDTDTLAAMAAGIWGARNGVQAIPAVALDRLEDRHRFEVAAEKVAKLSVKP